MESRGRGAEPLGKAKPMDSTQNGSGSSAGQASTISANDFLTLLVTEMKNQDPTANTDPNEYINQLVNVNSLEQLININQNLSSALGIQEHSGGSVAGHADEFAACGEKRRGRRCARDIGQTGKRPRAPCLKRSATAKQSRLRRAISAFRVRFRQRTALPRL